MSHDIVLRQGWLSQTPPAFQSKVLERCRAQNYTSGAPVYCIGDPPGGMYGMVAGGVAISVSPQLEGPYVAHFAAPGTWLGEAAAISGQPRRVGLIATRDTVLLHLPLHAIQEIVGQDASAWRMFALATVGHLDLAISAYDDLMIRDPVKRCIAILLRLGGYQREAADRSMIEIDLNQSDIASLANVARTTLNKVVRTLQEAGHVEVAYRRIRILAPNALRDRLRR
jgi:CRP-like cAMP-binding protein